MVALKHRLDDALDRQRVTEIGQGVGLAGQHGAQLLELATIGGGTRIGWQARHRSALRRRSVDELEAIPVGQPQFALRTDEPGLDQIGVGTTGTCRQ